MRFKLNKRAVSPVIAVVLLIALTVAAAAIIWVITGDLLGSSNAELVIDKLEYSDLDSNNMVDHMAFILRNIGSKDTNIVTAELSVNGFIYTNWQIITNEVLKTGATIQFTMQTIDTAQQLTSDKTVILTLTTDTNSVLIEVLKIPGAYVSKTIGEAGTVQVGATEVTVNFDAFYEEPVVVVTGVATDSSVVRSGTDAAQWPTITSVNSTSFKLKQTTDSGDGDGISTTNVNYIVMERGVHFLGSIKIVADIVTASGVYTNYTFASTFSSLPVVLASPQTNNMETTDGGARTRIDGLGGSFVTLQLEHGANSNPGSSYIETVGYIAIEAGSDITSQIQSYITADAFSHKWSPIGFDPIYIDAPIAFAHMTYEDGPDASYMSVTEITSTNFKVSIEEPPLRDGPHTNERVSWMSIPSGAIEGTSL